eukprot:7302770-Karenia_brevis.AAC.1
MGRPQRDVGTTVIGDFGYADDTGICGREDEVRRAERLLVNTLGDWEERVNVSKTERLRVSGTPRAPYDVRNEGE